MFLNITVADVVLFLLVDLLVFVPAAVTASQFIRMGYRSDIKRYEEAVLKYIFERHVAEWHSNNQLELGKLLEPYYHNLWKLHEAKILMPLDLARALLYSGWSYADARRRHDEAVEHLEKLCTIINIRVGIDDFATARMAPYPNNDRMPAFIDTKLGTPPSANRGM